MGKSARSKGSRGQTTAANLLRDRDWEVEVLTCGLMHEDLIAYYMPSISPGIDGRSFVMEGREETIECSPAQIFWQRYSVEVKNCKSITTAQRTQAMEQAAKRKLPWMLMSKIAGTSCWLVQRKGMEPVIWKEKIK